LLLRLYDVTSGNILVDGLDVRDYALADLRNRMGFVPQHPVLFNDTVLNNLRLGNPSASQKEIMEAAKAAYAHDFIETLGEGYETTVGEGGGRLSGGQRQRLALARAFLKNPTILLLDEATSALDSESEYLVRRATEDLAKNKTVLVIAHRLSTIQRADLIVVVNGGRPIAQGTHKNLLESCPLYRNLVEKQQL
jgi:ABC-type multidrug transport system fused ATPase/permease subunit